METQMKESQRLTVEFLESGRSVKEYNEYMRHYRAAKREEKKYEENVNANLFAVRALAFALLECRSEKEALLVIKYFARPKSRIPLTTEYVCGSDGPPTISE
jgi:hypothetical protein